MSYKTAFVSCIESDSCIIAFLKVLSKTSKGRYLDFKRASLTSQKGVNWKPIYALFVCSLRILFTKPLVLTKAIENLKDRSMRKLKCSSVTLSFIYPVYKQLVNLFPCQPKKRSSVTLSLFYSVLILLCLKVV